MTPRTRQPSTSEATPGQEQALSEATYQRLRAHSELSFSEMDEIADEIDRLRANQNIFTTAEDIADEGVTWCAYVHDENGDIDWTKCGVCGRPSPKGILAGSPMICRGPA